MWSIFFTKSYGKEIFLNSKLLELVHFWNGTPTNVRWNLNPFAQHTQEADGEMGGDSRRGEGRSWGWLWHWLHHLMCWKGCVVVNARTCCWLMPPGYIAEMARLTLVGNAGLTMEAPTGNPRLPRLLYSSLSHTQIHGRSDHQLVLLSLRWDLPGIPLPIFKCSYIQIPLWNEKRPFSQAPVW